MMLMEVCMLPLVIFMRGYCLGVVIRMPVPAPPPFLFKMAANKVREKVTSR